MTLFTPARLAGCLAIAAVFTLPVAAQGSMEIEGLDGRKATSMTVTTFSEGVETPVGSAAISSGRTRARAAQVPVTVTRQVDANTPALRSAMVRNVVLPSVTISFAGYEVSLSNARLSSATSEVDAGSAMETLVFQSESMAWRFGNGGGAEAAYDFAKGQ